mmetsp:Transcript_29499/g.32645  ORF Transcript_29499/g.32645 Transcript_29499/m.32645 type:complete len:85 (+) Transcript_29499:96-350(+)
MMGLTDPPVLTTVDPADLMAVVITGDEVPITTGLMEEEEDEVMVDVVVELEGVEGEDEGEVEGEDVVVEEVIVIYNQRRGFVLK